MCQPLAGARYLRTVVAVADSLTRTAERLRQVTHTHAQSALHTVFGGARRAELNLPPTGHKLQPFTERILRQRT